MQFDSQVLDPRRAGQLTRYHTWSRIREQSVAEHSWQVARLLLALWPEAPPHMLVYALFHDVGEVATGDLPYPIKRTTPELAKTVDAVERAAHLAMCVPWRLPPPATLSDDERNIFKLAEFIEMWEYALLEISLGNQNARLIALRCIKGVTERMDALKETHPEVVSRAETVLARRRGHERRVRGELGTDIA